MPGLQELLYIVVPLLVLFGTYRIGHRIGKAEGRLLGRDEAEGGALDRIGHRSSKTGG